jgi:hypothetical protein
MAFHLFIYFNDKEAVKKSRHHAFQARFSPFSLAFSEGGM